MTLSTLALITTPGQPIAPIAVAPIALLQHTPHLASATFVVAAGADCASTHYAVGHQSGREMDPEYSWIGPHPTTLALFGFATDMAGLYVWNRLVGKRHSKLAAVGLSTA